MNFLFNERTLKDCKNKIENGKSQKILLFFGNQFKTARHNNSKFTT